ncbi:hypothetical protein VTK26DRAFT_9368 [Humicola hyalothermophila]
MSGRSAYVRKKTTATWPNEKGGYRGRPKFNAISDNATVIRSPTGAMPVVQWEREEGVTAALMAKGHVMEVAEGPWSQMTYRDTVPNNGDRSSGSQSESSFDIGMQPPRRPMDNLVYARVGPPTTRAGDVSGIEKSGLRSALDKTSDDVRKGLAKAFTFKKDKKGRETETALDFRPQSSATIRPTRGAGIHPSQVYNKQATDMPAVGFHGTLGRGLQQRDGEVTVPSDRVPEGPSTPPIKRWVGAGRPVQRWNKLRKDPELWDPDGDVVIFLAGKQEHPRPHPSFRLSSHIIEATGSRHLITLLRDGLVDDDIRMPHGHHQPVPAAFVRPGEPTPPVSEDTSLSEADGEISYEMYFPAPPDIGPIDQLRHKITTRNVFAFLYRASLVGFTLHQALSDLHARLRSYMAPEVDVVGNLASYISARGIDDVRNDPEAAVGLLAWSGGSDVRWEEGWCESFLHCAGMHSWGLESCADFGRVTPITRALLERASLEAQLRVQAAEERLAEFGYGDMWPSAVSVTVSASGPVLAAPAKAAADRLRKFFVEYYAREFGSWPPTQAPGAGVAPRGGNEGGRLWLTRTVAQRLQKDFAALYDYLVDRDIVWDESETRSGRKWMMVAESGRPFEADTPDVPMTDMLIEFDNKHRFPHIPRPYPLVPDPIPPPPGPSAASSPTDSSRPRILGRKSSKTYSIARSETSGTSNTSNSSGGSSSRQPGAVDRRIQLAYTEAANLCALGSEPGHSAGLVDAFTRFEKTDHPSCSDDGAEVDPSTARRGRWVLIYGVLQTLASVSVDSPGLRYGDGVAYHLSVRLRGARMPPWKTGSSRGSADDGVAGRWYETAHELSHCWTVVAGWAREEEVVEEGGVEDGGGEAAAGSPLVACGHGEGEVDGNANANANSRGRQNYRFHVPRGFPASRQQLYQSGSSGTPLLITGSAAHSVVSYSESDIASSGAWSPRQRTAMSGTAETGSSGSGNLSHGSRRLAREVSVGGGTAGPSRFIRMPVEERDWVARAQAPAGGDAGRGWQDTRGAGNGALSPPDESEEGDEDVDVDEDSFAVPFWAASGNGGYVSGPGAENGSGSRTETEFVGPMIRDFDELGVIDAEDGYVL